MSAAALVVACGKAEPRGRTRPVAGAGDGGACAACAGEAGTPSTQSGAPPSDGGAAASGGSSGGTAPSEAGMPAAEAGAGGVPEPAEPGLVLSSVTISQSLEIPLMKAGQATPVAMRPVPLIAGKQALVRAFVQPAPGFAVRQLIGVLDLKSPGGDDTLVAERLVTTSSSQDQLGSTFVFEVKARDLEVMTEYRLRVLEADTTPLARFPEAGYLPLSAKSSPVFKLVLVPMVANGITPATGTTEVEGLRARMLALMPSRDVLISVAPPYTLPYPLDGDGEGWDDALEEIYEIRAEAEPADDVFYYGMLTPAASYDAYCDVSDCLLGYSRLAEEDDVESRGSIGITVFPDGSGVEDAWDTVVHELGHALGRDHSPCGVPSDDIDLDFPYPSGNLGTVYGYDFVSAQLIKPKQFRDVMGYCTPVWVSDYTYNAFLERLDYIAGQGFRALSLRPAELFRVARVDLLGRASWRQDRKHAPDPARLRAVDLLDAAGRRIGSVDARLVRYDHSAGGELWLPAGRLAASGAVAVDLSLIGGGSLPL